MQKHFLFKDYSTFKLELPVIQLPKEQRATILTKSRFKVGLKCDLLLWNQYNSTNTVHYSPKNESNLYRMNIQNNSVASYARLFYPNGKEVPRNLNMYHSHKITQELIQEKCIIYNACFLTTEFFSKTDILVPSDNDDSWEIIDVKSSINLKKDNTKDLAFQLHVAEQTGLKIKNVSILTVNPNYTFDGTLNLKEFFIKTSLLEKIKFVREEFLTQLQYYKELIYKPIGPTISTKYSCSSPKNCSLQTCWKDLGDGDIFNLREGGELVTKLYKSGIRYIKDVPEETELTTSQKIQIEAEKTQTPYIQKENLKSFLDSLSYPHYYLDFETVNPAIPIYVKSKPYQHVPFLYSLHIQENPNSPLVHFSYIDSGNEDPRKKILEELANFILPTGTIICYNDTFEKRCITESVQIFPEYSHWYSSISDNFKDLSDPFRYFYYYHPLQKGSGSLKAVLPALTNLDYKELGINDGNMANLEFLKVKTLNLSQEEIEGILSFLLDYCRMDTFAMFKVVEALNLLIS